MSVRDALLGALDEAEVSGAQRQVVENAFWRRFAQGAAVAGDVGGDPVAVVRRLLDLSQRRFEICTRLLRDLGADTDGQDV